MTQSKNQHTADASRIQVAIQQLKDWKAFWVTKQTLQCQVVNYSKIFRYL